MAGAELLDPGRLWRESQSAGLAGSSGAAPERGSATSWNLVARLMLIDHRSHAASAGLSVSIDSTLTVER